MKKKVWCLALAVMMALSITACDDVERKPGEYQIFYLNREVTKVQAEDYDSVNTEGEALVKELLERLATAPKSSQLRQTIPSNVVVNSVKTEGAYITVDFGQNYKNMSVTEETLVRAAIVKTLLQISQYSLISFTVDAEPLRTSDGVLVGNMTLDSFVENPGAQINASIQSTIKSPTCTTWARWRLPFSAARSGRKRTGSAPRRCTRWPGGRSRRSGRSAIPPCGRSWTPGGKRWACAGASNDRMNIRKDDPIAFAP